MNCDDADLDWLPQEEEQYNFGQIQEEGIQSYALIKLIPVFDQRKIFIHLT